MEQILLSVAMAVGLSFVTLLSKVQKGEGFDIYKAGRTFIVGLVIGFISWQQDIQMTNENWDAYLAANMGVIAVADQGFKFIWRLVSGKEST